ncbi:MAG: hypothetical protein U1A72_08170, partial [Sulfuritalea sp.]|nr:hypothetical protein [Sulfuritalea sp.]
MLKYYVFWGLFALVLIGIAATLMRDRQRRLMREAAEAKPRATPAPPHQPVARPLQAVYDPTATRVHVRT